MNLLPEIQAMISKLRMQLPDLAGASDEQILMMIQRAQLKVATNLSAQDLDKMSAEECGVMGAQHLESGNWDEAKRCFVAVFE
ncbi:hypothetical protein Enr10x_04120 [Gimesia panareensis]|uniref:Uncharacterized protein n=1 Tax=Gimesia panareensis TaxID=2527978 RepID=A0A517Q0F6_9PLAN|nr:hypothetical protein [Gimesia panareensis]QDT25118.1 hypothetical protein Enr10x_04120 [Gimesia panareensis]